MRFFTYRHQIGFADTMAYGSHHFLTNFKLQCLAREALLFLRESGGSDPWREQLKGVELLTQQGYARNLRPVGLGDWLAVMLSAEKLSYASFRLCFRVVTEDGSPVTCGFQTIVCIGDGGSVVRTPTFISEHLLPLVEPQGSSFQDLVTAGGRGALEQVFWPALREAGAAVASGESAKGSSFATIVEPTPTPQDNVTPQPLAAQNPPQAAQSTPQFAWLCAGQARPDPAWVRTLAQRHSQLRALVEKADELCRAVTLEPHLAYSAWLAAPTNGGDARATCLNEQLTIYLTAVMTGRALENAGLEPTWVMGHSVGEIAALALAGVVSDMDGLTIVARRTEALLALTGADGGLVAVQAGAATVSKLLVDEPALTMAVHNHADQVVVAGGEPSLRRFIDANATAQNPRETNSSANKPSITRLASRFAFHSPLMLDAVAPFARSLGDIAFKPPTRRLFSPMERAFAEPHWQWPQLLASHLIRPLHFADAIAQVMADEGSPAMQFVECNRRGSLRSVLHKLVGPDHTIAAQQFISTKTDDAPSADAEEHEQPAPIPTLEPMAIVGRGCVLPGAPDPAAFAQLVETDRTAITNADSPAIVEALSDFYAPTRSTPDKTYALLSGRVDQLAPLPKWLSDKLGSSLTKVIHLAALALLQCDVKTSDDERIHVVLGSTADGCGEFDEAVALARLAGSTNDPEVSSACAALTGREHDASPQLEPHGGFGRLVRAIFGSTARVTVLDAACASSLYAIDIAARLFAADEADVVIAGGAFAPGASNNCLFAQFGGLSSEGSRPLDACADGVVFGEGAAFLTLRRLPLALASGHNILGVVRGWGYSSDGRSASASAPKTTGQRLAVSRAYQHGRLDPRHTQYVEAHGTGTRVGDAVEFETLKSFFEPCSTNPLPIGSVKSQLGHTGWVAGAASLIKVLHLLQTKTLPAQQCFEHPNPKFDIHHCRLTVPLASSPWPANLDGIPRRAAVNGFGFGGTNGHVVIEAFHAEYHTHLASKSPLPGKRRPAFTRTPTKLAQHSLRMTLHEVRKLPAGLLVLPEVLDSMDRTQLLAIKLAAACMEQLGPQAGSQRAATSVFVSLAGRTQTIVEANDRLFADRFTRLLSAERPKASKAIRAAVQAHIASVEPSHSYTLTGGMPNITAGRVCQLLGFNGPNFVLDPTAGGGVSPQFCARSAVADGSSSLALALEIEQRGDALYGTAELWSNAAESIATAMPAKSSSNLSRVGPGKGDSTSQPPQYNELTNKESPSQASEGFDRTSPISTFTPGFAPLRRLVAELPTTPVTLLTHNAATHARLRGLAESHGWPCALLSASGKPTPAELQSISKSNTIVIVHDLSGHDPRGVVDNPNRSRVLVGSLMRIAKARYDDISCGAVALGVVCLGGWIDDEVSHPDTGLVAGFLKSLRRELKAARLALVHTDGSLLDALAHLHVGWSQAATEPPNVSGIRRNQIVRERPLEVFIRQGQSFQHALRPLVRESPTDGPAIIDRESVIVATGGGRGITAELVVAAIQRFGCRAILLGRTDPALAPAAWRNLNANDINQLEPAFHAQQVRAGVRLRDSKRAFQQRLAAHELRNNLTRLRAAGEVDYAICDVTDGDAIANTIARVVRDRGRIDLLLHGAGVQVSARLVNTTADDFWRTIDTKIAGLRHLLAALAQHPESRDAHIHLATSAFSYLGNDGQHSYGAANEAMNRLADAFASGRNTRGAWSAMAWLAWDGIGMTRGSEYRTLAGERRLRGVGAEEGGEIWTDMLASPLAAGSHILLSDNELKSYDPLLMAPRESLSLPPLREVGTSLSATDSFDPRIHPFLLDHRVDDRPVLPACLLVDGIITHAEALFGRSGSEPALVCSAVEDCRLLRFFPVARGEAHKVTYKYRVTSRDGEGMRVAVQAVADVMHNSGILLEEGRVYATCNLVLTHGLPTPPASTANGSPFAQRHTIDPFVADDSPVALAGDFDCVRELTVHPAGNSARFRPAAPLPMLLRGRTLPALLLDVLLRVGIIGVASDNRHEASAAVYVPVAFARLERFQAPAVANGSAATIHCGPSERDATSVFCPRVSADNDGYTLLRLSNYSGQLRVAGRSRRVAKKNVTEERAS